MMADLWDEHDFEVRGGGSEWVTTKGTGTTKNRSRGGSRRKNRGGGKPPLPKIQKKTKRRRRRTYPHTPNVSRG